MESTIGETLRIDRARKKMSLEGVAKMLKEEFNLKKASTATVQRLEANERDLMLIEAIAFSEIYDRDLMDYIILIKKQFNIVKTHK